MSDRIVRHRLLDAGLRARILRKKLFLNAHQDQKIVGWAKQHINWIVRDWSNVIGSDETPIAIFGTDGRDTSDDELAKNAFLSACHQQLDALCVKRQ